MRESQRIILSYSSSEALFYNILSHANKKKDSVIVQEYTILGKRQGERLPSITMQRFLLRQPSSRRAMVHKRRHHQTQPLVWLLEEVGSPPPCAIHHPLPERRLLPASELSRLLDPPSSSTNRRCSTNNNKNRLPPFHFPTTTTTWNGCNPMIRRERRHGTIMHTQNPFFARNFSHHFSTHAYQKQNIQNPMVRGPLSPSSLTNATTTTTHGHPGRWNRPLQYPSPWHSNPHRSMSSSSWIWPLSEVTVWGHSGTLISLLHADGLIPYWACFALVNVLVRLALFPVVIYGAHASHKFGKVLPEIQFLLTLCANDLRDLARRKASLYERWQVLRINGLSLSQLYKHYKVDPLSIFLSPLLQIPIFWYLSVDLRKLVNGLDPALAQELVDHSKHAPVLLSWIPDLTEPDPWFGLPMVCGALLYVHMEVAMGSRRNHVLEHPSAHKANSILLIKDIFQCVAVFLPCCTSQMAAGMQIYLTTTFTITLIQSQLLKTASVRSMVGLPPLLSSSPPTTTTTDESTDGTTTTNTTANTDATATAAPPKFALRFIRLKQLEQEAIRVRREKNEPLLGVGVLYPSYQGSFAGEYRPSTIQGSLDPHDIPTEAPTPATTTTTTPLLEPTSPLTMTTTTTTEPPAATDANPLLLPSQGDSTSSSTEAPLSMEQLPFAKLPFVHGVSAPLWQQQEQAPQFVHLLPPHQRPPSDTTKDPSITTPPTSTITSEPQSIEPVPSTTSSAVVPNDNNRIDELYKEQDEAMDQANRGERPIQFYQDNTESSDKTPPSKNSKQVLTIKKKKNKKKTAKRSKKR